LIKNELFNQLPSGLRAAFEQEWGRMEVEKRRVEVENKLLKEEIRLMRIEKYGPRSEKLSEAQFELLEVEPSVMAAEIETEAGRGDEGRPEVEKVLKRKHPGRTPLPAHLPRQERIIPCPAEQCRCEQCGRDKELIGYESSEMLEMEPVKYYVAVTKREKKACRHCEEMGVTTAAWPEARILEKSKASNRVIVDVLISKYCNHVPLYRQCASFEREAGIELSRMTLCGWVMECGLWLAAICGALRTDLLEGSYIQVDETTVGVQSARTAGKNHQGYLWEYSRPGGPVVFDFRMGRSREGPEKFLGKYSGILQSDGYAAYDRIGGDGLRHAGCMAHARRGFVDALKAAPGDAAVEAIIAEIAKLYGVEKRAREAELSPLERQCLRQVRSVGVLAELKNKIVALRTDCLPKSAVGKACDYALNQWPRLELYVSHGEVEIDNNWCENAIRPLALGRKNWLHIGSEEAGPRVAAIASIVETCRRLGINVRDYLLDVLPKVPSWPAKRIAELTPQAWAAANAAQR
jgi:transposase